jgi:hypothetical protein
MKWFVFAYDKYYPLGGSDDCKLITTDLEKAKAKASKIEQDYDYVDILTIKNNEFVLYDEVKHCADYD